MSTPHLSRLRVQKYCRKTYFPNVFTTFLQLFFTFIDCQRFINALFFPLDFVSPFFWLDTKETKTQGYTTKATNSLRSAKIPVTRASRSDSRDFFTLHSKFALRLLRQASPVLLLFSVLSSYFSPSNSQFSIFHSQLAKSRRVFIISRRLFSKRRRLFLFLCRSFKNK